MEELMAFLAAARNAEWAGSKMEPYADEYWWEWNEELDEAFFDWVNEIGGEFDSYGDSVGDFDLEGLYEDFLASQG